MKKLILSSVVCASMMFAASDYKYEITPMVGGTYTEGNLGLERDYVNAGLSLGFNIDNSIFDQIELGFLRSVEDVEFADVANRDTGVTRTFANVIKDYPLTSNLSAYALLGAGVEFFDDEYLNNKDGIFANYGAGLKYKLAEQLSLKFDVRHAVSFEGSDNNLLYNLGFAIPFGEVAKPAPAPVVVKPAPVVQPTPVVAPIDSDADGVADVKDKCPNTIKGAEVDMNGCMTLVNLNINFDTDSSVIKPSYDSKLEAFAKMMKTNTKLKATIEAHTDSVGSKAYNQKLSEKRAASTIEALKALDVDTSRLNSVGYGETKPVASNMTKEGRAQNRRVHAVVNK